MNRYYLAIALDFVGGSALVFSATLLPGEYRVVAVAVAAIAGSLLHSSTERLADLLEARQILKNTKQQQTQFAATILPPSIPQSYKN
jgi:hypothetical protein